MADKPKKQKRKNPVTGAKEFRFHDDDLWQVEE